MGRTLLTTVCELVDWADRHAEDIDAARDAFDSRPLAPAAITARASVPDRDAQIPPTTPSA